MSRVALVLALVACSHGSPPAQPLHQASDLVVGIAEDWSSTTVTLTHWKLSRAGWTRVGEPWPGVLGKNGLAWGDGLHGHGAPKAHDGPVKREGDGRSPAGAFRITQRFAFASEKDARVLDDNAECVDDPRSRSYNQIVERSGSADWSSSEHMRAVDQYALGAVIDHNPDRVPGDGSCIFLHIWAGPDSTTVGCTAMDEQKLRDLLGSLGAAPVLVQLPKAEYDALREPWGLPAQ